MTQPTALSTSSPGLTAGRVPVWVSVAMAIDAIGFGIAAALIGASGGSGDVWHGALYGILVGGPYLVLPELMRRRPRPLWLGAIAAASIGAALLTSGVLVLLSLGWSDTPGYAHGQRQLMLLVLLAALGQLTVIFWVIREVAAYGGRSEAVKGFGGMMVWPVVAGMFATMAGNRMDSRRWHQHLREEVALTSTAVHLQRCAIDYAARHPELGYPPSVIAMGPAGTKCLTKDDVARTQGDHAVLYVAEPEDAEGRVDGFVVRGSGHPAQYVGTFSVWGDTSGVLARAWGPEAIDETNAPGDGVPVEMQSIHDCVAAMVADGVSLPANATRLAREFDVGGGGRRWASRGCSGSAPAIAGDTVRAASYAEQHGYRLAYTPVDGGYRIDARPASWGETGLRSYTMRETGPIHYTLENRAATEDDAELPPCPAYDVGDCTPTPLDSLPDARFLHPARLGRDQPYTLGIRATGDERRFPKRLSWAFECRVESSAPEPTAPLRMLSEPADFSCPSAVSGDPGVGDSIVVRLWLRNDAGLTRHVDHVIAIAR